MCSVLPFLTLLVIDTTASAKDEPELPLCPTNIQYFPQTLPMHCRMPANSPSLRSLSSFPGMPKLPNVPTPYPPSFYQSLPPDKVPSPFPYPLMPGFPAPIITQPQQAHKLPVIVMPFYSPDKNYHNHDKKPDVPAPRPSSGNDGDGDASCDTDLSGTDKSDDDSAGGGVSSSGWWKPKKKKYRNSRRSGSSRRSSSKRRRHGRKDLLTPLIQYVTKDGYVIFEKEISKAEATDWLNDNNKNDDEIYDDDGEGNGDGNGDGDTMNAVDEAESPRVEKLQQAPRRALNDQEQEKEKRYKEVTTTEKSATRRHRSRLRDILKEQRRQVRVVAAQDP